MKKSLIFAFIFAFIGFLPKTNAQNTDITLIQSVINDLYFEGWLTGDTTKVGKAMHSSCHLKVYRGTEFVDINRNDYLGRFKPQAKDGVSAGRIVSLDITGNIAAAKCEIETPKAIFTDYFNLIKMGETWYIVDKISTRKDK